ncbi:MAG: hypothetical protein CFE26_27075, partial [Verrucomicrobiales bacterium VVV1]
MFAVGAPTSAASMLLRVPPFFKRWPLAPLLCFIAAWAVMQTEVGEQFELRTLDWRPQWRAEFHAPPDDRLADVLFD